MGSIIALSNSPVSLEGAITAARFVHKFRQEHTRALNNRLQKRRGALTKVNIRLMNRRMAIVPHSSGLVAHLDAIQNADETLCAMSQLLQERLASCVKVPSCEASLRQRRMSAPIDWESIRRDINTMPDDFLQPECLRPGSA